jgi:class 3 adenylate cyclase
MLATAILAADVTGYFRLMGADEKGTHERLRGHLRALIEPKIAEYRGRIVKNTGDGFLAEFASVVDAVRCAVEMQWDIGERNAMPWSLRGIQCDCWRKTHRGANSLMRRGADRAFRSP